MRRKRKPPKATACDGKRPYIKQEAYRVVQERRQLGGIYMAYRCRDGCYLESGARAWPASSSASRAASLRVIPA